MRIGSFQADEYGELQRLVDSLYSNKKSTGWTL